MPEPWAATLFSEMSAGPVDLHGHRIWLAYWLDIDLGDRVHVLFQNVQGDLPQGLRLALDRYYHGIRCGDDEGNRLYLWAAQGPRHREVEVVRAYEPSTLSITNCWREPGQRRACFASGPTWLEPALQADGSVILRAGDGTTPVGIPTLTVRLIHEPARRVFCAT